MFRLAYNPKNKAIAADVRFMETVNVESILAELNTLQYKIRIVEMKVAPDLVEIMINGALIIISPKKIAESDEMKKSIDRAKKLFKTNIKIWSIGEEDLDSLSFNQIMTIFE